MDITSILEGLSSYIKGLGDWAYAIICVVASLETAGFTGFVFPGETWAVFVGFLSARGILDIRYTIASIAMGGLLGDNIGYLTGRTLGRGYFHRHSRFLLIKREHIQKMDEYFARHGGSTIFIGRFISFARSLTPFSAGLGEMNYGRFFPYDLSAVIVWTFSFTLLGYFFGRHLRLIEVWVERSGLVLLLLIAVAVLAGYVSKKMGGWHDWISSRLHGAWAAFLGFSGIGRFLAAHPGIQASWRRVTPPYYLAAHLVLATAASAGFARLLGWIAGRAAESGALRQFEHFLAGRIVYLRSPQATRIMLWAGYAGSVEAIAAGSLLLMLYLFWKRDFVHLFTYAATLAGSLLIARWQTHAIGSLPAVRGLLASRAYLHGSYFIVIVVAYAMAAYIAGRLLSSHALRVFLPGVSMFAFLVIGISRLYLGISGPSEMVLQLAVGLFYVLVSTIGLKMYRHMAGKRPPAL
ncbi:MAG: VTT domain-containing protein [Nitrospiraceae bacterium]|nr:VTT domain-containing protein [Nitrospiraceae bacterium]